MRIWWEAKNDLSWLGHCTQGGGLIRFDPTYSARPAHDVPSLSCICQVLLSMEQDVPSESFITCHYHTRCVVPVWRFGLGCTTGPQAMPNLADRPLKRTWEEMGPYSSAVGARLNSTSPHGSLVHHALKHQCIAQYKALHTRRNPDTRVASCAHSTVREKRSSQYVMEDCDGTR